MVKNSAKIVVHWKKCTSFVTIIVLDKEVVKVVVKGTAGRSTNTIASDGYAVSNGRPTNTKAFDGYLAG